MKDSLNSKNTLNTAVPKSDAARQLSEGEKKALELAGRAEHETGRKREILQAEARRKAENG
jgi:hypothetical protein